MTSYRLNHFTMADAQALAGKTADITEWDDDELERKVTYLGARITGIIVLSTPCLVIGTFGAVITDAQTGEFLGTRPPEPELRLFFTWICEVTNVRGRFEPGDRIALEHTSDPDTPAPARRRGNRHPLPPETRPAERQLGQRKHPVHAPERRGPRPPDHPRPRGSREGAGPVSVPSPQPAVPPRQAAHLGRRHGRAAVYWQIGDSDSSREFYQELLSGIASADPAITGLYAVPDLAARWDYERENLAADLGLADGDPALDQAAGAFLAAAREEFWLEAARLARRRLTPRR